MDKPSPPKPPDYAAGADAQGQANVEAALAGTALNNPNQVSPFGTVSWSNPQYDAARAAWQSEMPERPTGEAPHSPFPFMDRLLGDARKPYEDYDAWLARDPIGDFTSPGDWTQTRAFSPELQALFDRTSKDPLAPVDFGGVEANRNEAEEAVYRRATRYLDPQVDQGREALKLQLQNQGIYPGSEAYTNQMRQFEESAGTNYADARDRAITLGGAEADRSFSQTLQAYMQKVRERALPVSEYAQLQSLLPGGTGGGQPVAAAPILEALMGQFGANQANYATQAGMAGSGTAALAAIASALIGLI